MSYLREDLAAAWQGQDPLVAAFALQGEVHRAVATRKTLRVQIAGRYYFAKLHYGVGWAEVLKNWLQFKRPVLGAENEYHVCRALEALRIPAPVPAAFARGAGSIARRRSFVVCDELVDYVSLEQLTEPWPQQPPGVRERRQLLHAVAHFARTFHAAGFVHRDFYICHLLLNCTAWQQGHARLAVLDLHRARRFDKLPDRWRRRDLAALLYSTLDLDFTRASWLRFVRLYSGRPLREELAERGAFWRSVLRRAEQLYREGQRKGRVLGRYTGVGPS